MRYPIGAITLLGLLLLPGQSALACSLPLPSVPIFAEWAEVVAVGTLVHRTEDVITLQLRSISRACSAYRC